MQETELTGVNRLEWSEAWWALLLHDGPICHLVRWSSRKERHGELGELYAIVTLCCRLSN